MQSDRAVVPDTVGARARHRLLSRATLAWTLGVLTVRVALNVADAVPTTEVGTDLMFLSGWPGVALLLVAATVVGTQARQAGRGPAMPSRLRRVLLVALGAGAAVLLLAASALLLVDMVGAILPGLGIPLDVAGALGRLGCAGAAGLVGRHTWRFWHATRDHSSTRPRTTTTPRSAYVAAYLTVAACLTRVGAQLAVDTDENPLAAGASAVLFEVGFLLAGILLPLALVHRWGRVWPRWVPGLRGRTVPRRLVAVPGGVLGVGITTYFGVMLAQMVVERAQGRNPFPPSGGLDLPEPFFWVSVPAYVVWGAGLVIATIHYLRMDTSAGPSSAGRRGASVRSALRRGWRSAHEPVPGTPRWAPIVALTITLLVVPSSVWRIAVVTFAVPIYHGARGDGALPAWLPVEMYVVLLSVASEVLAFTAYGLVARWGESVPAWMPRIGGRRIHPLVATVPAGIGAALLTIVWTTAGVASTLGRDIRGTRIPEGETAWTLANWEGVVFVAAYAPLIA